MGQGAEPRRPRLRDGGLGAAVARARAGEEAAFAAAYRLVQPGLLGYLRGLVGAGAEGVAAGTWQELAYDLGRFRGDGAAFRAWAATVARRRALALLRRRAACPSGPSAPPAPSAPSVSVPERDVSGPPAPRDPAAGQASEPLSADRFLALIGELPRDQREAVLLRVVVGLDGPATARVLGRRPGAVRTAARRGLDHLARRLGSEGDGGGVRGDGAGGPGEPG